ncbi:PLDc N-terminal domain-containing protein [Facklamia miroungae]|uniref:Phospholipase_D-nuclease N-terminal n=1 Tax=Facklamia miroungae TaxID=120956 RepID=A0A1G7UB20_9LACT|nr:PLDc N-terminal domain-containing protein [Facklamia miroungae]NKZ30029.1 hypothetical protein [Facklamia miroungae]SDG44501.1 Phospholipase_D-nuclease N-terminal [Facklamia miroungae]
MVSLKEYLPILIPIVVIEIFLLVFALKSLFKQNNFKFGNKSFWILIVVLIQIIGPILYLMIGKEEK